MNLQSRNMSNSLFEGIVEAYQETRYCDLEICGQMSHSKQMKPILCHKLVVCSFISKWHNLIRDDTDYISLPNFRHEDLQRFFSRLYESLLPGQSSNLKELDVNILAFLGVESFRIETFATPELLAHDELAMHHDPISGIDDYLDLALDHEDAVSIFHDYSSEDYDDPKDPLSISPEWKHPLSPDPSEPKVRDESEVVALKIQTKKRKRIETKVQPSKAKRKAATQTVGNGNVPKSLKKQLGSLHANLARNQQWIQSSVGKHSIELATIYKLLKGECHGQLKIDVTTHNVGSKYQAMMDSLTERKDAFFALIGVQEIGNEMMGQALAWTSDEFKALNCSLTKTIEAFQSVFGLARVPLLGAKSLLDVCCKSEGISHDLYRKFVFQSSRQQLANELKRAEIVEGFAVTPPTRKDLSLPLFNYTIQMTEKLDVLDDILLVGVYPHGVEIRKVTVPTPHLTSTPERMLSRLLRMVWVGGNKKDKFKATSFMSEIFLKNARLIYTKKKIERLLASDEEIPRPLPTVICDICGKQIQENTCMTNLLQHRQIHSLMEFECQCGISFRSFAHKKQHYQENHVGEAPIEPQKKSHQRSSHEVEGQYICDTCGKVFQSLTNFHRHIKRNHSSIPCEYCDQEFESVPIFRRHFEEAHPSVEAKLPDGWLSCPECDLGFPRKQDLSRHMKTLHVLKAHKCGQCQKSFTDKYKLKYHVLNVHLKSRPFICRSEGCNSTFNYSGNLYAHEKKFHGGALGKATPIDELVPDDQLDDLGCQFERTTRVPRTYSNNFFQARKKPEITLSKN